MKTFLDSGVRLTAWKGKADDHQAAMKLGTEEFITTELPGKPLFRVVGIRVTTLHAAVN